MKMEQTLYQQLRAGLGPAPRVAQLPPQSFEALSATARRKNLLPH
jgi:hypothetical protein